MAHASDLRNVIPALCTVGIDCRLLPGQSPAEAEQTIRELIGPGDYELVNVDARGGTRSRGDGPLWDAVAVVHRQRRARGQGGTAVRRGLHRLALAA